MRAWLIATMALVATGAHAEPFFPIDADHTNMNAVESMTIKHAGGKATFWLDIFYPVTSNGMDYAKKHTVIDCSQDTIAIDDLVGYDVGNATPVVNESLPLNPTPIVPSSVGSAVESYVCSPTLPLGGIINASGDDMLRSYRGALASGKLK